MAVTSLHTRDWAAATEAVAGAYFPHQLRPLAGTARADLLMRTVDLGPVTVGRLGWGADVAIDCDYPDAYEVNIAVTGALESRHGNELVVSSNGEGTIFPADRATPITRWHRDCTVIGVKFGRDALERDMERVLGDRCALPAQLTPVTPAAHGWLRYVRALAAELPKMHGMLTSELVAAQLAGTLTAGFLLAAAPDQQTGPPARPRIVGRVLDAVHDDPARPWTAAEMAAVAGVSVRRLQEGFAEYVGETPRAVLRRIRLERAHADLAASAPPTTVTDVALRWGFTHPGRFASAYRRRYGVSPSWTLRQG